MALPRSVSVLFFAFLALSGFFSVALAQEDVPGNDEFFIETTAEVEFALCNRGARAGVTAKGGMRAI